MQSKSNSVRSLALGLLVAAILTAGCKPPPAPPATRPHEGKILRVACPDDATQGVMARFGKAWAKNEGLTLEVLRYQRGEGEPPEADVWVVSPADMPRWAAANRLLPVPESYQDDRGGYAWKTLLPLYRKLLYWDRQAYALPLLGEAPLCFYRKDLYDAADQRDAFRKKYQKELAAPTAWEEFADQAEFFRERQGKPSLPPLAEDDEDLDREFHRVAAPVVRLAFRTDAPPSTDAETFSFHYDLETGQPRLETPGFVAALQLLQRLQLCRPLGTHPSPPEVFRDGEAVLCVADATWITRFRQGRVGRGFGVCPVPGSMRAFPFRGEQAKAVPTVNRVPYLGAGGWLGVVPVQSREPEAAFALLAELSSREKGPQIVMPPDLGAGGVTRVEQLDDATGWLGFDLDPMQTQELRQALRHTLLHTGIKNPLLRLRTPDQAAHLEALMDEVRTVLLKGGKPDYALVAATRRWRDLDARKSEKDRKRDYLLNLWLHGER